MAWCKTAPSHYLNQYWLTITEILWHSSEVNFSTNVWPMNPWHAFENYTFQISFISPTGQWVNNAETIMPFWRNFHRWLHQFSHWWKFHQLEWRHFRFSESWNSHLMYHSQHHRHGASVKYIAHYLSVLTMTYHDSIFQNTTFHKLSWVIGEVDTVLQFSKIQLQDFMSEYPFFLNKI